MAKTGADDFFARGGTFAMYRELTRPYDPADFAGIRLRRDKGLKARVKALSVIYGSSQWKGTGGHTRRAVFREAIERAARTGKVVAEGLQVMLNQVSVSEEIGVSRITVGKALRKLEEKDGLIRKVEDAEAGKRSASYVLLCPEDVTNLNIDGEVNLETDNPLSEAVSPSICKGLSHNESYEINRLRWSYVRRVRVSDGYEHEYVERLGKIDGHALECLVRAGGVAKVRDVIRAMNRDDRPGRFIERHFRKVRAASIVTLDEDGETVRLTPDWLEKLRLARGLAGEYEAEVLQQERHERARRAFRRRHETRAEPVPDMIPIDDMRESWTRYSIGCACRECSRRFGRIVGEHVTGCKCATCFSVHRRNKNQPTQSVRSAKSMFTSLAEPAQHPPATLADEHPLDCSCIECSAPIPRYVKPYGSYLSLAHARVSCQAQDTSPT